MKTIGLLGGMSWESTTSYYQAINVGINSRLGGLHSAKICLHSVDFAEIEELQRRGQWQQAGAILGQAASALERAGAEVLLICTNTMHKVAGQIEQAIRIPLLHIADATAEQLVADGIHKVGLLGTSFTMEDDFYQGRLREKFGINVLVPDQDARQDIHSIIFSELCQGVINPRSRNRFLAAITDLNTRGAEAVILGCTEIALLVQQQHSRVPLYDTTAIHAARAVEFALAE